MNTTNILTSDKNTSFQSTNKTAMAPFENWSSPRLGTAVICCFGGILLLMLLALNAAQPSGRPIIKMTCCDDPVAYFSTAHALLFHHDFDLTSEFRTYGQPLGRWTAIVPSTGRPGSAWAIGFSLLEIPFMAAGTGVDALTHQPADGYSKYAVTFYYAGILVFLTIGLLCLFWFLYGLGELLPISQRQRVWTPLLMTLVIWPATTLGYYTFSPMSHVAGFMTMSVFLLCWWHTRKSESVMRWVLLGALGALAALCRWQNAIYLAAPPLCDFLHWYAAGRIPQKDSLTRWFTSRVAYCIAALLALTPQLIEWKAIYGKYLLIPQGPGFYEFPPRFIHKVLFSTQHGWFVWTPLTLIGVIGLVIACFRFTEYFLPWLLILGAEVIQTGAQPTNWDGSESFGIRSLTCSIPVVAIGLVMLIWLLSRKMQPVVWSLVGICTVYSIIFAMQYRLDLLPKTDRLVSSELFRDKIFLREAYARNRSAREASTLMKKGDTEDAIRLLNNSIQRYGEDRFLLKNLAIAYTQAGDASEAQETGDRLQQFLDKRLF